MKRSPSEVAALAQLACLLEASAAKPGNVSPGRPFRDMSYEDFLLSALAIGPALTRAGEDSLGATIRNCVDATAERVGANTNLGIVLLCTPIARAANVGSGPLRESLRQVLAATTISDAREAYSAIRRANPGGLSKAQDQDLSQEPSVTLSQAMELARDRDSIAREYVTGYGITFEHSVPTLTRSLEAGLSWPDATVETYLTLLAGIPDSLIIRKCGLRAAQEVSRHAGAVLAAGGSRTEAGKREVAMFDAALRDSNNTCNPGTTADLTAAAIFVVLLERGWPSDRRNPRAK